MGFDSRPRPSRRKRNSKVHVHDGFPHFCTAHPHHCMCLQECCQDYNEGCICKLCPCQTGYAHDDYLRRELDRLEMRDVGSTSEA